MKIANRVQSSMWFFNILTGKAMLCIHGRLQHYFSLTCRGSTSMYNIPLDSFWGVDVIFFTWYCEFICEVFKYVLTFIIFYFLIYLFLHLHYRICLHAVDKQFWISKIQRRTFIQLGLKMIWAKSGEDRTKIEVCEKY